MEQIAPPHFHVRRRAGFSPYRETVEVTTDPARVQKAHELAERFNTGPLEVQEGCTCTALLEVDCPMCRGRISEGCELCHGSGRCHHVDAVAYEAAIGERQGSR